MFTTIKWGYEKTNNNCYKLCVYISGIATCVSKVSDAEKYYKKSIDFYLEAGNSEESCLVQLDLAYIYGDHEQFEKAFKCYDNVYRRSIEINNVEITINTLTSKATLHREKGFEDKEA